jgi:hypothetical protein
MKIDQQLKIEARAGAGKREEMPADCAVDKVQYKL